MVGENYTNTFGGETVSPANLSYVSYTIEGPIDLRWAFEAVSDRYVTADKVDINCTVANAFVRMPPANQVTVGQDILFGNIGVEPYVVTDYDGTVICVVNSGIEWFVYLTANSTLAGSWRSVQFGASTSAGTAADLAGSGLRANLTKLEQNLITVSSHEDRTLAQAHRALFLINDGGNVTYTLPDANELENGWFVYIRNGGDGNLLLQPIGGDTIDDNPNMLMGPDESLILLCDDANFHTVGYGRLLATPIAPISIDISGSGLYELSAAQRTAQVQDFTGTLTGNRRVEYTGAGYWFVWNTTNPLSPYTVTVASGPGDTDGVILPQAIVPPGVYTILRSNGAKMAVAFSGAVGTVTEVRTEAGELVGGPITVSGTISLAPTGVTQGTYGAAGPPVKMPIVGVDLKGRVTSASEVTLGSSAGINTGNMPGQVPVVGQDGNLPSQVGAFATGDIVYSIAYTKPGFVLANSGTVGSVASGAWGRAHADTWPLFNLCWYIPAAYCPMYTAASAGSNPIGRGPDAITDFNANFQISVPDLRGSVIAGLDNAGGTVSRGAINFAVPSTTMGASGGWQAHTLTIAELAVHGHGMTDLGHGHLTTETPHGHLIEPSVYTASNTGEFIGNYTGGSSNVYALRATQNNTTGLTVDNNFTGITIGSNGSGHQHNNTQFTTVMNPFIKL